MEKLENPTGQFSFEFYLGPAAKCKTANIGAKANCSGHPRGHAGWEEAICCRRNSPVAEVLEVHHTWLYRRPRTELWHARRDPLDPVCLTLSFLWNLMKFEENKWVRDSQRKFRNLTSDYTESCCWRSVNQEMWSRRCDTAEMWDMRIWRVGSARNAVFFHSFVASPARKVRS